MHAFSPLTGVDVSALHRRDGVPTEASVATPFHCVLPLLFAAQVLCAQSER